VKTTVAPLRSAEAYKVCQLWNCESAVLSTSALSKTAHLEHFTESFLSQSCAISSTIGCSAEPFIVREEKECHNITHVILEEFWQLVSFLFEIRI
jgi:hypothetical protein